MEDAFRRVKGVVAATSGYQGGTSSNPTYGDVCSGKTGHAEVVKVEYDPAVVSFEHLVSVWLGLHDPTGDARHYRGGQYRSLVYFTTPEQEAVVKRMLAQEQTKHKQPIVTEAGPAPTFWRAEEYHQQYYAKNRGAACRL